MTLFLYFGSTNLTKVRYFYLVHNLLLREKDNIVKIIKHTLITDMSHTYNNHDWTSTIYEGKSPTYTEGVLCSH